MVNGVIMSKEIDPIVARICEKKGYPVAVVEGVLGDLAMQKETKISQMELAERWSLPFGALTTIRNMGKVLIQDIRDGAITKKLAIANAADDHLMDRLSDPDAVQKISARDLSTIAKQNVDSALNLNNGQVGSPQTQINIGDLRVLIDKRESSAGYVPIRDRLKFEGKLKSIEGVIIDEQK